MKMPLLPHLVGRPKSSIPSQNCWDKRHVTKLPNCPPGRINQFTPHQLSPRTLFPTAVTTQWAIKLIDAYYCDEWGEMELVTFLSFYFARLDFFFNPSKRCL